MRGWGGGAESFGRPEEYAVAVVLHAFLEPASEALGALGDDELAASGFWVPLPLLHRQHAWARLSGYPDTPPVGGAKWHALLQRWLAAHAPTARLATHAGQPGLLGVRRVHPAERQPALPGWDVLQLLSFFRVGKLLYVPWADDTMLLQLPLPQLWPSLNLLSAPPGLSNVSSHFSLTQSQSRLSPMPSPVRSRSNTAPGAAGGAGQPSPKRKVGYSR